MQVATVSTPTTTHSRRRSTRREVCVEGRLTWKDASGTLRFASVITRNVSDVDAFVECQAPAQIPRFRLVHFQVERAARGVSGLPPALQRGKVLSAVYRVGARHARTGMPQGYALRLLVDPSSSSVEAPGSLEARRTAAAN